MKPVDHGLSKHCGSCQDMDETEPGGDWDGDDKTRYVCGEWPEWTADEPCTIEDIKRCPL